MFWWYIPCNGITWGIKYLYCSCIITDSGPHLLSFKLFQVVLWDLFIPSRSIFSFISILPKALLYTFYPHFAIMQHFLLPLFLSFLMSSSLFQFHFLLSIRFPFPKLRFPPTLPRSLRSTSLLSKLTRECQLSIGVSNVLSQCSGSSTSIAPRPKLIQWPFTSQCRTQTAASSTLCSSTLRLVTSTWLRCH